MLTPLLIFLIVIWLVFFRQRFSRELAAHLGASGRWIAGVVIVISVFALIVLLGLQMFLFNFSRATHGN